MNERELLQAVVDHLGSSGNMLRAESPIVTAARELLSAPAPCMQSPARLPIRAGLTDEEKVLRRGTLGSSEIAAVCGVNPYASVHSVWLSKCRGVDFEGNEATTLGNLLEPTIFAIYADRYDRRLTKGVYTVGPEPWMSCTPDAYIDDTEGLVEAKLVGLRSIFMWGTGNHDGQESDAIPLHYLMQAFWQMAVTGRKFVDVSALMGTEFRSYTVRENPGLQAKLIERGREFWHRYVATNTPPPVDGSKGATEMLKELYPRSGGDPVRATPEMAMLADSLRAARAACVEAETAKRLRENEIKERLGEASGVLGDGWRIRYSTTKANQRPFVFEDLNEKGSKAA